MSSGVREEALFLPNSPPSDLDEAIQHDVLFRTGRTMQGRETFTPRLILMDLKESLATLKQEGYLYEDPQKNIPIAWATGFPMVTLPARASLVPQQLAKPLVSESLAPAWSDFLRTKLHPRTILTIHEYNREEESSRLEAFGQGEKLLQDGRYLEELEDRLHFYGFQLLCDLHNGFSGVGSKAVELLQDEYAGKGILTSPTPEFLPADEHGSGHRPSFQPEFPLLPVVAERKPGAQTGQPGGPAVPPPSLDYHTSAVLATALDTLTVAEASAALPFSVAEDQSLPDALYNQQPSTAWCPLSSCGNRSDAGCFAQSVVLRGIGKRQQHGFLSEKPLYGPAKVESIPVLAAFRSSAGLYRTLDDFYRELRGMDLRRWASFFSAGVEMDDFREALDELRTLSLCYKKSSLDENSDDDTD
ncbi:Protein misato-like 1, partial [Ophiophagus hannah]